jgi:mono/diheme cytochrome c family protein
MPSERNSRLRIAAFVAIGLGLSSVALGLPWDVDMADGQQRKAFSLEMRPLPEGVVAQPTHGQARPTPNVARRTPEADALVNPLESNDQTLARGKAMYGIYCTPCHGDGVNLGPVAQPGRFAGVAVLAGPAGVLPIYNDGHVYLTIRNGGERMPAYGWAMSDEEMWSVVSYVRTLENGARAGSNPATAPAETP